ncbi:MarR family winged helix-turn-helix transcriptional regulator [Arthrobacter sp. ISL-85]|uniref:MarR family winged helix-turn-helix transcriptional regulator n=1 Tax=Arthrobacter sp. ISL-85 TaxID=2819115 RepID=UPI0020353333|nr:MarR family transcriptional regulator [Arthrobacter sp. ISL-85]
MPLNPGDSPGFLLWHATLRWQRDTAAALAPLGLTHVQFVLLACAWWLNTQGERPNKLALARQEREVDPADTRAKRLHVTDAGADLAPRAIAAAELADAQFFRPVPLNDAVTLLSRLTHPEPQTPSTTTEGDELDDSLARARRYTPADRQEKSR